MWHFRSGNNGSRIPVSESELERLRQKMVDVQIIARGVKDPLVLEAMSRVKRHEFVLPGDEREAYEDSPLPIGEGQTISQPYIVAAMTELAKVNSDSKVLEIGTGSGYQTAVLAELAKEVYSIEIVESLAHHAEERLRRLNYTNVHCRLGDAYQGWPEEAPFDVILVTAAPNHIPQPLIDQLKADGRLVIPIGDYYQELEVITKTNEGIQHQRIISVRFVPMKGEAQRK
ncbi:MAG: protein-L-isoaspartate O-methyltransferase [Acidobacteria bacterium]|nr:MAG: protein-L-isoaspartate O-methyltransferase [Acidobacteriota bacterium]